MKRKLMYSRGESIAESLVSILIVALASILFAGMVTASRNIIDTSRDWMKNYYEAVSAINNHVPVEGSVDEERGKKINFTISTSGNPTQETVTAYISHKLGTDIVSYIRYKDGTTP